MSVIEVEQLSKVFKIPKKDPGLGGAVMNQIDVRDSSLSEPELSDIVKQIYNGALEREAR